MNSIQKIGGIGAVMMATYFVWIFTFVFAVLPAQGFTTPEALIDPVKGLTSWTNSPALYLLSLADLLFAAGLALAVLALYARLRSESASGVQIGTVAGLVAVPLFLATGMTAIIGIPQIIGMYQDNPNGASAAYAAVNALNSALGFAAVFAYGWWLGFVNWNALRAGTLPKPLALVGLVLAVACILFFAIQMLAPITLVLGLVWSLWLGIVLLQSAMTTATAQASTNIAFTK
jgi:hypothetical protein